MRALPLQLSAEYKQRRSPVHAKKTKKNPPQQKPLSHVQLLPIYYHIYYYYLSLNLFFLVNCPGFYHLNAMKITKLHMHKGFAWKHQAGQKQNQNPPSCPCFSCTYSTSQEQEILHISWTALLTHHHARDNRLVYSSKQLSTRIFVQLETHPHHTTDVREMHAHTEHIFKMNLVNKWYKTYFKQVSTNLDYGCNNVLLHIEKGCQNVKLELCCCSKQTHKYINIFACYHEEHQTPSRFSAKDV